MKVLVLFSGTGSVEKVFETDHECRGLDILKKFQPYYLQDILTWNYQQALQDWTPDYIHASPVCKEFSFVKNAGKKRDMNFALLLLNKTLEIIQYVLTLNPSLKYTIENPVGLMRKLDQMKPYQRITTSYCQYGFPYQKQTDFWFGGFDLKLRKRCGKHSPCSQSVSMHQHPVRLCVSNTSKLFKILQGQIGDDEYLRSLKLSYPDIAHFNGTFLRYRIPSGLIVDLKRCVEFC